MWIVLQVSDQAMLRFGGCRQQGCLEHVSATVLWIFASSLRALFVL